MKYMGSKNRYAKELLPIILKNRKLGQYYVEPFVGGCNMIDKVNGNRIGNDVNYYLVEMWRALVAGWVPVKFSKDEHRHIRLNKGDYAPHIVGWVGFNCSYSGVFFEGYAGETKTKIGTIRDYQSEAINNVLKQLPSLENVVFENRQYWSMVIPTSSIIYCDPPYEGTSKYKTGEFDHSLFWDWVRNKSNDGNTVFISEYAAPDDFDCIWEKTVKSSLSANGKSGSSKESIEKLFIHKKERFEREPRQVAMF